MSGSADRDEPTVVLGLERNLAGALAYSLTFISGLFFYVLADDEYVRFHATQSIVTFGGIFALVLLLELLGGVLGVLAPGTALPATFALLSSALGLFAFVLWIVLLVQAARGRRFRLPGIGRVVDQFI
ncbi:hypothetical protein AArcSl_0975 [Halalkaliarchaeum desulfuricum]|uniref:DUF4870 domain-containing protein n=1 Tax=Halalkaliarchaeum desulfuricum TaxID=2055893 RepID=A0A343THP1_9EURY|nr:hypothetical protein [Halalkaliarchaeum desulfuricum]AUX08613.1 hypothetical protein AArcSl_0975 [Halalkaliarchaeum desulfuricum]